MKLYDCHSKPRANGYYAQAGWMTNGLRFMKWIEDTATKDCQYRKGVPEDPRCHGCTVK